MSQTQVQSGFIGNDSVTSAQIAIDAVTTAKIADSNVTTAKIADANITPAKLSTGGPTWNTVGTLTAPQFSGNVTGNLTGNATTATALTGSAITLSTEQSFAAAGNTFTGIPSWAKKVTIIFDRISVTATTGTIIDVLLGSGGTFTTTGYASGSTLTTNTNVVSGGTDTSAFSLRVTAGGMQYTGHMVLTKMSGNKWVQSHTLGRTEAGGASIHGGGVVTLLGTLDSIRILPNTVTTSFDNGSLNIMYE
jgi:hypothetical protein